MSKCGQHPYDMIEFLGIGDMKSGQLYRAQINTIDTTLNTADITLMDTCVAPAALTAVPFFYHCEFSTGTVTDLAYGHRAFKPLDEVYALFVPARDNNDPPRFYVVGHVDIWDTRYCVKENFVLMTVQSKNQVPNIPLICKTIFNMQTMKELDLATFISRAGSPPAPTSLPVTYLGDTELTRPDVLAFHSWFDYNFVSGYSPARLGATTLSVQSADYSPMTPVVNDVNTVMPQAPACGLYSDVRHYREEYTSQPSLFGNPPVKFQETWSDEQYNTVQGGLGCTWDGSTRTRYTRTYRNYHPDDGVGTHVWLTIEEVNAQSQVTYSSYMLWDYILDSSEDYTSTQNMSTGAFWKSGPFSRTNTYQMAESSFGIGWNDWKFTSTFDLALTVSPTFPVPGVLNGTYQVRMPYPLDFCGRIVSAGTDYVCVGLYIPYEEYTITFTNASWIGQVQVPGDDNTNSVTEPNPVKIKLKMKYYNFGPDLPYNTYISTGDIITNHNYPIESKIEAQFNLMYAKISERLRSMFPAWNTSYTVYMTDLVGGLADKIPQMVNHVRRTS